jgi:chemotaxis signal transduction protein
MKALVSRRGEGRSALQRADELGKRAEYLAFMLGTEAYAIQIGNIVEILKPLPITEVPRADPEVVGVMSVRGRLVTVVDLKRRFHLARSFTMDKKSRILLVDAAGEIVGAPVREQARHVEITNLRAAFGLVHVLRREEDVRALRSQIEE